MTTGGSTYTREMADPADLVEWLDDVLDELGLDRVMLAGYSYGAWQSALYALAHPDRLDKLVLLAPSATVLSPGLVMLVRAVLYYLLPCRSITRNYFLWYGPDAARNDRTRARVHEMVEEDLLARRCFKKRRFIPPTRLTDAQWGELRVPTLFLVGENDRTYSAKRAVRRLHQVAPAVEAKIAPNTDHYMLLVNPDWVICNTLEFLERSRQSIAGRAPDTTMTMMTMMA